MPREYSLDELAEDIHEIKSSLERLTGTFVTREVYEAHRQTDAAKIFAAEQKADSARAIGMWAMGLVASLGIGGIGALIKIGAG